MLRTFVDEFATLLTEGEVVRPLVGRFVARRRSAAAAAFDAARAQLKHSETTLKLSAISITNVHVRASKHACACTRNLR